MFLTKYKLGIQYALKTRYSNGVLERTNNKIKVIKRVAYGYRNFHNIFRARIYLIQGLIFQVKQKPVKHSAFRKMCVLSPNQILFFSFVCDFLVDSQLYLLISSDFQKKSLLYSYQLRL